MRKIDKRRRIEGKTDYRRRLILLKRKCPRLIVRKSNRYILLQIVESSSAQDKVITGVTTKELLKYGWSENKKGSLKSLGASYLGGLLIGKKIKDKIKKEIILDSGLNPSTKGSRIYAAVKGISDSGIKIRYNKEIVPPINKIKGKFDFFEKVKQNIEGIR